MSEKELHYITGKELCAKLLQDDALAEKAAARLEKEAAGKSAEETAVAAAQICKKLLLKSNAHAFEDIKSTRLLSEQFAFSEIGDEDEAGCYAYLVSQLSPLHRFLFVLKAEAGLDNEQIAKAMKMKPETVEQELAAAWNTMRRTLDSMEKDKEEPVPMYAVVRARITDPLSDIALPEQNKPKKAYINPGAAAPAAPKKKKKPAITAPGRMSKKRKILYITAACLFVIGLGLLFAVPALMSTGPVYADITIENHGTITVQLDPEAAPTTVENFTTLAENGFYDGLTFHRIIEGFMMQGGDPNGNGTGGSETKIVGEFAANGYENPISHTRGTISMARGDSYNSASSQFFIMHQDYTGLDGQYAAFGHVTSGMEIVDAICTAAQPIDGNGLIDPAAQPVITSVTIRRP